MDVLAAVALAAAVVVQLVEAVPVAVVVVVAVVVAAVAVVVVVGVVPLLVVVEIPGYLDYSCWGHCLVPFCCLLVACDVVEVVADSFHVHLTVGAAVDDEPVVVHDGFDSAANGDAALLVAVDGMEVADGNRPVGSWRVAVQSSCRDCYAAVYPDDTDDDLVAGHGAAETSFLRQIGSVDAVDVVTVVAAAAAAAEEVDSELDQALANASSALQVVVPCSAVVDTVADDADGVFRCRPRGHLRPL